MTTRVRVLVGVVAFLFAAIVTRLWFLQVLAAEEYQERARGNRVRLVPLPAPRGKILDRSGQVLVEDASIIEVTVNRRNVENEEELLLRLSEILETPVEDLTERLEDPTYLPFQPVPIAEGVSIRVATQLKEQRLPGVNVRAVGNRVHPHGSLAAHVLGYLGQISQEELDDPSFGAYRPGDEVGRGGVEQHYEHALRGKPGLLNLQVDSLGRVVSVLGRREAEAGNDLVLSLDLGLQQLAEESMRDAIEAARGIVDEEGRRLRARGGSVVALDPANGHVLAMASYPTFDPRVFADGLSDAEWRELTSKEANFPLNNRVVQGQYPAASTLKPFVASAAFKAGLAAPGQYYACPPEFEVPGDTSGTVFHNWKSTHSGHISVAQALVESCDTVFYQWGYQFYRERSIKGDLFQRQLRKWGFGDETDVDLPSEAVGRVPDADWKQAVHDGYPKLFPEPLWLPGDSINMSIGQGDLLVTPLQLAVAYGALANGGTLYRPELGLRVEQPDGTVVEAIVPREVGKAPLNQRHRQVLVDGLRGAVVSGTAATSFTGFPHPSIPVAGKTGTAEVVIDGIDTNHSWFAAFAPIDDPKIVVVAMVEEGGHGSETAAPIVRRVLEGFFGLTPTEFKIGVATD